MQDKQSKSNINFDEFTDDYNEISFKSTNFFSKDADYFAKYKIEIVREISLAEPSSILEYGCGIGRNIEYIKHYFPNAEIVATDISSGSIEEAKKDNENIQFYVEDPTLDKLFEAKFDLIILAGVVHHIPPVFHHEIFSKLLKRLKINGQIIIFEHNPFNPITRKLVNNCAYDEGAVLISCYKLKKILKHNGFSIKKSGYCLFIPPNLISHSRSIERYLRHLPLGGQYWIQAVN